MLGTRCNILLEFKIKNFRNKKFYSKSLQNLPRTLLGVTTKLKTI